MKKLNAILGFLSIAVLLGHLGTMTYSMLTGWYSYNVCKTLAHVTAGVVFAHMLAVLYIVFFMHDGASFKNARLNVRVIVQRASAIVIVLLLHRHVKDFGFIAARTVPGGADKVMLIVTELLFFAALFSHLAVSFSRGLISLGLVTKEKTVRTIDMTIYIFFGILFAVAAFALIRFVVTYGGH